MEIKTIIHQARIAKNLTMKELADKVGVSEGTVSRWESGEIENMRRSAIAALCKILEIEPSVIMGFENKPTLNFAIKSKSYNYAPCGISAGELESVDPITDYDTIEIPDIILGKYAKDKNLLFMHVNGDSMNKVIENGALIAVKTNVNPSTLKDGDIVVIKTDESYTIKRFFNDKTNKRFILKPDSYDETFMPIIRDYSTELFLVGKVVVYNVIL